MCDHKHLKKGRKKGRKGKWEGREKEKRQGGMREM